MVVGENVAVGRNNDSGAKALFLALAFRGPLVAKKLAEKWINLNLFADRPGRINRNHRFLHRVNDIGITGNDGGACPAETGVESMCRIGLGTSLAATNSAAAPMVKAARVIPERVFDFMEQEMTKPRAERFRAVLIRPSARKGLAACWHGLKSLDAKQAGDALVAVDAHNGLAEQAGHAEHPDGQAARIDGNRVGRDEFVDIALGEASCS